MFRMKARLFGAARERSLIEVVVILRVIVVIDVVPVPVAVVVVILVGVVPRAFAVHSVPSLPGSIPINAPGRVLLAHGKTADLGEHMGGFSGSTNPTPG